MRNPWIIDLLKHLWNFLCNSNYQTFWTAMAVIITFLGLWFIWCQIRRSTHSTNINILLTLRDRFWSDEMVSVRKKIKNEKNVSWLVKLKSGEISEDSVKVYSPDHIPRFTIIDFFESIGTLCRRDKKLLKFIYPLMCGDIIFHYRLHEHFNTHKKVKPLYPRQNFKFLAEACIKKLLKETSNVPTFDNLVKNM